MVSNFIRVMDFMNNFGQEVKYNPDYFEPNLEKIVENSIQKY